MKLSKEVSSVIREKMKEKKITGVKLANMLYISDVHLSNVLNGNKNITLDVAEGICSALDLRVSWLMGCDEWKTEEEANAWLQSVVDQFPVIRNENAAIEILARHSGYDIARYVPECFDIYNIQSDTRVKIFHKGELISDISSRDFQKVENQIIDFIAFTLSRVGQ